MRRRGFLAALACSIGLPRAALAQARRPTLGLLYPNPSTSPQGAALDFFAAWLKEYGWSVGRDLALEHASAEGREDRLPGLAKALVDKRVDVIWAAGPEAALAAARATRSIPIAFYGVGYPVEQGFVDSLAKPGRNVTGLASFAGSERAKGIELLRAVAPKATRLSWIGVETVVPTVNGERIRVSTVEIVEAAAKLGFEYQRHSIVKSEDFESAFASILSSRADAMGSDFTALTWRERKRIVDFALKHRLPIVTGTSAFVEAGALLSYGANREVQMRQSFAHVDRLLRGARPAELPVELPTKFELSVNLKTAKAIGIAIPQSLLLRADRVIE